MTTDRDFTAHEIATGKAIPEGAVITGAHLLLDYIDPETNMSVSQHIMDSENAMAFHIGNLHIALSDLMRIIQECEDDEDD